MELNQSQKSTAINLYKDGVTHYREISEKLGVTYNAVNRFMTKWKKEQGILSSNNPELPRLDSLMRELTFLRQYYLDSIR